MCSEIRLAKSWIKGIDDDRRFSIVQYALQVAGKEDVDDCEDILVRI